MNGCTGNRSQAIGLPTRGFLVVGRVVAMLVLATVLTGPADAQAPAVEARDSSDDAKPPRGAGLPKTADAPPERRARPARKLTVQQKRIFVLGLGAGGKK